MVEAASGVGVGAGYGRVLGLNTYVHIADRFCNREGFVGFKSFVRWPYNG